MRQCAFHAINLLRRGLCASQNIDAARNDERTSRSLTCNVHGLHAITIRVAESSWDGRDAQRRIGFAPLLVAGGGSTGAPPFRRTPRTETAYFFW